MGSEMCIRDRLWVVTSGNDFFHLEAKLTENILGTLWFPQGVVVSRAIGKEAFWGEAGRHSSCRGGGKGKDSTFFQDSRYSLKYRPQLSEMLDDIPHGDCLELPHSKFRYRIEVWEGGTDGGEFQGVLHVFHGGR